jgi:hypothetical protein
MPSIQEIEAVFPALVGTNYSEESKETDVYNCIAFALGDVSQWWWPRKGFGIYWPPGFQLSDSVDVLVRIFEVHGYSICDGPRHEIGYEKVGIYSRDGRFKHAVRQLESGRWVSKLGEWQDIEHEKVEHVEGAAYGVAECFLRRKRGGWLPSEEAKRRT